MKKYLLQLLCIPVLLAGLLIATATGHSRVAHAGVGCPADGWVYDNITKLGDHWTNISSVLLYTNDGSVPRPKSFTATYSQSQDATLTVSAGVEVDVGAVVEGVKANLNVSGSEHVGINSGLTDATPSIAVAPGHTFYAQYGVHNIVVVGHYYYRHSDCSIGIDQGDVETTIPLGQGWNMWGYDDAHLDKPLDYTPDA